MLFKNHKGEAMKKIILTLSTLAVFSSLTASTWTCYRYVNGQPTGGFVKVSADTKEEAEKKAFDKYKELGYNLDYVKCK